MALTERTLEDKIEIQGYEGLYSVTSDGRVWSHKTNKWLKPARTDRGYMSVRLNGKTQSVHRLVALTFCENLHSKTCINHINGDKADNRAVNLEWCSYSENHKHAFDTKLRFPSDLQRKAVRKQGFKNRRFSFHDAQQMRQMYSNGMTQTAIAMKFNTTAATVSNVVLFKTYTEEAV